MPLKLNVGASRKVTDHNYGSRGASINVEMELDSALITEPPKLQEKIGQLFDVVRVSLAAELNSHGQRASIANDHPSPTPANANGAAPRTVPPRPATASQVKALHAIARNHDVNLSEFLYDTFRIRQAEELTIKQASAAIDDLKSATVGPGGH